MMNQLKSHLPVCTLLILLPTVPPNNPVIRIYTILFKINGPYFYFGDGLVILTWHEFSCFKQTVSTTLASDTWSSPACLGHVPSLRTSFIAQLVKKSACNAGDPCLIPGSGRSSGEGNGNPCQFLAGESHGQMSLAGYTRLRE